MEILFNNYPIKLKCDDDLIVSYEYFTEYNIIAQKTIMKLYNYHKKKSINSGFVSKLLLSFTKQVQEKTITHFYKEHFEKDEIIDCINKYFSMSKHYRVITEENINIKSDKDFEKYYLRLVKLLEETYKKIGDFLKSKNIPFIDEKKINLMKKKSYELESGINYSDENKKNMIIKLSEVINAFPFTVFYDKLGLLLYNADDMDKLVKYTSHINSDAYSAALSGVVSNYFQKNKERLFKSLFEGKISEITEETEKYFWFDKESLLNEMVNDIIMDRESDFERIDLFLKQFEKINEPDFYISGMEDLYKLRNITKKIKNFSSDKALMEEGYYYVRSKKLLKYAKAFEARKGFFYNFLYAGPVTSVIGSGLIWSFITCILTMLIGFITEKDIESNFITTQFITVFIISGAYGAVEWFIYIRESSAWNELTDFGRVSLYSLEKQIDDFYKKNIDIF
jgi:hypothetical protein